LRVLIVDDDPDILNIIRTACESESMEVDTATSAEELWRALQSDRPDVILLDIMLPDASGLDLIKRIRSTNPNIPIIFLTARKSDLDMILGLELGADDYVTKPFNPRALVARIKAVLRRTEVSGKLEEQLVIGEALVNLKSYTVTRNGLGRTHQKGIRIVENTGREPRKGLHPGRTTRQSLGNRFLRGFQNRRCPYKQTQREGRREVYQDSQRRGVQIRSR